MKDEQDQAKENFVSQQDSTFYAKLYQSKGLAGGHVILLNGPESSYYQETKKQAIEALRAYPGGLQIGGGITPDNAKEYLNAGASHVIVTSYVFQNGQIHRERLEKLVKAVGRERLVLDVSCRKKDGAYYVVTDRWQKYTQTKVSESLLDELYTSCDQLLIHGVDVEGTGSGIEKELVCLLGSWGKCPITYAGGIGSYQDLETLRILGKEKLDFTVGSKLDIFGGTLDFEQICSWR